MLFTQEDAPSLKGWLMKKLPEISDTETDILADYVIALLSSQEGDVAQIRAGCEAELPAFLNPDTASDFIDELFRVIEYRSYLPGAPPPPLKRKATLNPAEAPFGSRAAATEGLGVAAQNGSKKRSYYDLDELQFPNDNSGRAYKQPRRNGRGGAPASGESARSGIEYDPQDYAMQGRINDTGPSMRSGGSPERYQPHILPPGPYPPPPTGISPFNPIYLDHIRKMQDMDMPFGRLPDYASALPYSDKPQSSRRKKARCRDFENKGYCARGNSCQFDHGSGPIFIPPPGPTVPATTNEYDAEEAVKMISNNFEQMQQLIQSLSKERGPGGRRGRGGSKNQRRRQNRAPFSADGPVTDRTKSTIVVENIPEDSFSEEAVRGFFSEFGIISEVTMKPYKHLAVVKFETWDAANAAYQSPKVIFDNRFVKVYWFKEGDEPLATGTLRTKSGSANGNNESHTEPEIDMKEFTQKQEEAQRIHNEKMQKKLDVEKQRQELVGRQQELLTRQREERQRLHTKLAASKKSGLDGSVDVSVESSTSSALRAQLEALEEEAKLLGLDPNAADDPTYWTSPAGRGRGRGRGGYRGRGNAPRGRGSYLGNRNDVHAAYAAYSLDNRPRKIAVTGVDFTMPEKDEVLRQHLLGIGEFTDIQTTPTTTQITFKDRKTAEKFFYGVTNKMLPGIDGQVELAWVSGPLPPVTSTTQVIATVENGVSKSQQALADSDMVMSNPAPATNDHDHEHPEMDYDVADDNDWGVE